VNQVGKARTIALILCVGAFALLSMGADSCADSAKKAEKASSQLEKASTPNKQIDQQVSSIALGSSVADVEAKMGKPDNEQEMNSAYSKDVYLYYGQWQLTFTNDKLDSKNKY
jgi:hypothetical protein